MAGGMGGRKRNWLLVTAVALVACLLTSANLVADPVVAALPSASLASASLLSSSPALARVTLVVNPSPKQVIQGLGASGAWWPNDLVHFPNPVQERVADLLFSDQGIALSSYRYNIGGGGRGVNNPTRAPQSFLVRPGVYNWSADQSGMAFLRLARDHEVPVLVGFANSAPPQWATNGQNCGGQLVASDAPAFAGYLAEVIRHLHDSDRITLSYLSPMNEPDNSFASCGQEGMGVPVAQRAALVQAVGKALAANAAYARVIADESSLVYFQFLPEVAQWLAVPGTSGFVAALAHHAYEYPTDSMLTQVAT